MKVQLHLCVLLLAPLLATAQGKITFRNDSNHLFVLRPGPGYPLPPGYPGLNEPIAGTFPDGVTLIAGLYAGTSSATMTLQTGAVLLTGAGLIAPGLMASRNLILNIPGGVSQFFQVVVWNSALSAPGITPYSAYFGLSPVFQATPGTSITYPSIMPGGPANSTWAAGELSVFVDGPEPSAVMLFGLGLMALAFLRSQLRPIDGCRCPLRGRLRSVRSLGWRFPMRSFSLPVHFN